MPIADSDVKWVSTPKIGLFEQLYVPAIFQGLQTTVRHARKTLFGGGAITQQFPEVEPKLPPNYRGVHRLNRDEQGRVKCVACYMCSTACPAHCIDIVAAPSPWADREPVPAMSGTLQLTQQLAKAMQSPMQQPGHRGPAAAEFLNPSIINLSDLKSATVVR